MDHGLGDLRRRPAAQLLTVLGDVPHDKAGRPIDSPISFACRLRVGERVPRHPYAHSDADHDNVFVANVTGRRNVEAVGSGWRRAPRERGY
ncbi:hypothetical protein [Nonomuraea sp. NPDC049400]|uniref:hypothetical protein n=1 Tax=Nonomuraea sp. NPDC049400 TaxID=3364352 RepID=UPI0037A80DA7